MRIDAFSLIAAQSASRSARPEPAPSGDKALFEPLDFPKSGAGPAASKPQLPQPAGIGSKLDITV
jgi:hypothetical protein